MLSESELCVFWNSAISSTHRNSVGSWLRKFFCVFWNSAISLTQLDSVGSWLRKSFCFFWLWLSFKFSIQPSKISWPFFADTSFSQMFSHLLQEYNIWRRIYLSTDMWWSLIFVWPWVMMLCQTREVVHWCLPVPFLLVPSLAKRFQFPSWFWRLAMRVFGSQLFQTDLEDFIRMPCYQHAFGLLSPFLLL